MSVDYNLDPFGIYPVEIRNLLNETLNAGPPTDLDYKEACKAATTANITLSGEQTIDGVSVLAGDRVLVKNQSLGQNNGIYDASASTWTRSTDADSSENVKPNMTTFVSQGTVNADTNWVLTNNSFVFGTTALVFAQTGGGSVKTFSNSTRPVATSYAAGTQIFNTSDGALNVSDGTNWRDSNGNRVD